MNGGQDLGGVHGFGPVVPEPDEPWFHAEWERRAFALTLSLGFLGRWNIDMSRYYRENRSPADYYNSSYYALWFKALEKLVVDRGLVSEEERRSGTVLGPRDPALVPPGPQRARELLSIGASAAIDADVPARFAVGQRVRVRNLHPTGHTRMPRYCRGRSGTVEIDHGVYIFPDTHAMGQGKHPQHCYNIRFSAQELWGRPGPDTVRIDLWDDYLEPA
jgi:nitrile hydratase beta subunit